MKFKWGHPPAQGQTPGSDPYGNARGFTFVEVVLMIVILSILTLILTPRITDALGRIRLNAAAQKLVADIRYARGLAISNHDTHGVEFNTGGNFYQLFQLDSSTNTKTVIGDPHKGVNLVVDYDLLPEFGGTVISSVNNICTDADQCTTKELRVDAFGVPKDRLDVAFSQNVTVVLQNGSFSRTVRVTPETAFTELV